jgi:hypothetical protein
VFDTIIDAAIQSPICEYSTQHLHYSDRFHVLTTAIPMMSNIVGPQFGSAAFLCHKWPVRNVERYQGPWNHTLKNPILVIGNEADPITPLAGAKAVADELGLSAVLVEQDDFGHASLAEHSDCTTSITRNFFTNGTYPVSDDFCPTNQILFPTNDGITKASLQNSATLAKPKGAELASADNGNDDLQKEVDSLKSTRKTLYIVIGALGIALILIVLISLIIIFRTRRRARGNYDVSYSRVGGKGVFDVDQDEPFVPPSRKGGGSDGRGRYSDPYDAPSSGVL